MKITIAVFLMVYCLTAHATDKNLTPTEDPQVPALQNSSSMKQGEQPSYNHTPSTDSDASQNNTPNRSFEKNSQTSNQQALGNQEQNAASILVVPAPVFSTPVPSESIVPSREDPESGDSESNQGFFTSYVKNVISIVVLVLLVVLILCLLLLMYFQRNQRSIACKTPSQFKKPNTMTSDEFAATVTSLQSTLVNAGATPTVKPAAAVIAAATSTTSKITTDNTLAIHVTKLNATTNITNAEPLVTKADIREGSPLESTLSSDSVTVAEIDPVAPIELREGTRYNNALYSDGWQLFATSQQGLAHLYKTQAIPCQDSHAIRIIDDQWGVVVVCDGAGSQLYSQYGAEFVAQEIANHLAFGIPETNIYMNNQLPTDEVWRNYCKALVLQTRKKLEDWVIGEAQTDPKTEGASIQNVGCTLIWAVYSPLGLLTGHVGDGRAGFKDANGWQAMMTPWEGEYSNQTVFINTDSIYADQLENPAEPNRPYLESRVIQSDTLKAFVLMSDGCESGLYETVAYDAASNSNVKINKPHGGICDNIIQILDQNLNVQGGSDSKNTAETSFANIVAEGNTALKNEGDDKTLVLGFVKIPTLDLNDEALISG